MLLKNHVTSGLLLVVALAGACSPDPGPALVQKAEQQYREAVEAGALPDDPAVSQVLESLARVPDDSKAKADARKLSQRITAARQAPPPLPLARNAPPGSFGAERVGCVLEAKAVGWSSPTERESKLRALAECRRREERLRATQHPEDGQFIDAGVGHSSTHGH